MIKKDSELRNEFLKHLNSNFKLTNEEENINVDLNVIITNSLKRNSDANNSHREIISKLQGAEIVSDKEKSNNNNLINTITIEENLSEILNTKNSLIVVKKEIGESFDKLKSILESRNELSNMLKEFNNATKAIMNDKEK
jgi:hypothetical protein